MKDDELAPPCGFFCNVEDRFESKGVSRDFLAPGSDARVEAILPELVAGEAADFFPALKRVVSDVEPEVCFLIRFLCVTGTVDW